MHSLASDTERVRDVAPGPASAQGVLDSRILELVSEFTKRDHRSKLIGLGVEWV